MNPFFFRLAYPSLVLSRLLIIALLLSSANAELIPNDRLVSWRPGDNVGVLGGIPKISTIFRTLTPSAGDRSGEIQDAINNCPVNQVVYLAPGIYRLDKGLAIPVAKKGIILRGAGQNTVLEPHGSAYIINVGAGASWNWPYTGNRIVSGLQKGSTTVGLGDTSVFSVGQLVQFGFGNDPSLPVVSTNGYDLLPTLQPNRRQMAKIISKTASTLTFSPPLYDDYTLVECRVHAAVFQSDSVGVEDMSIDCSNSTGGFAILFDQCVGCWVKGVKITNGANYLIAIFDSVNCEVRQCHLGPLSHTGSNGSGLLVNTVTASLFEDNCILECGPSIEVNFGTCGCVFSYNYCTNSKGLGFIDSNHGPHNCFNLYEGNIADNFMADGYFGSASHDTLFRNWVTGMNTGIAADQIGWCITLKRFTRKYSLVGNIIGMSGFIMSDDKCSYGYPNMGNSFFSGYASPWVDSVREGKGTFSQSGNTVTATEAMFVPGDVGRSLLNLANGRAEWITGYTSSTTVTVADVWAVSGAGYRVAPGPPGFQELDTQVLATTIRKGNFNYHDNAIPSDQALNGEALRDSYYLPGKPLWFGTLAWPPFDPKNPTPKIDSIPAGYRYVHGTNPPTGAGLKAPSNLRPVSAP